MQTPANAAYSAAELEHQLRDSGAKCLFTCVPLLETSLQVAQKIGLPRDRVYILELPTQATEGKRSPAGFKTVDDLVEFGRGAPEVEALKWGKGKGASTTAFLCYSSGTSGLPVRFSNSLLPRLVFARSFVPNNMRLTCSRVRDEHHNRKAS